MLKIHFVKVSKKVKLWDLQNESFSLSFLTQPCPHIRLVGANVESIEQFNNKLQILNCDCIKKYFNLK